MELLIVIAIIGILVSISTVSYSSAQKKGRDARRHSDLKAVQNAWEQYYADNGATYPSGCTYNAVPTPGVMSATYLPGGIPVDPKSSASTPVTYASSCVGASYCFCGFLEGEVNSKTPCAGPTPGYTYVGVDCVGNLQ